MTKTQRLALYLKHCPKCIDSHLLLQFHLKFLKEQQEQFFPYNLMRSIVPHPFQFIVIPL